MWFASCWCLLFLLFGSVKTDRNKQEVIKAFAELHSIQCHTLLFTFSNEFNERGVLLDFHKALNSNYYTPTALENIINIDSMINANFDRPQCSRSLRSFIMGNVSHIVEYMIAGKKREDIKKDQWLIFVDNDLELELITSRIELSMRSEVYIARTTTHGYEFLEIYQPAKNNPIRINYYGDWDVDTGLRIKQRVVLERRRDFGGAVLRAATFETQYFDDSQERKSMELLNVVWHLLETELNFTTEYVVVPDNSSEYQLYDHPNEIIVQMLAKNEADVSLAGLSFNISSLRIIDYSTPLVRTESSLCIKKKSVGFDSWWHILNPFPTAGWYQVILIATTIPVIISFIFYFAHKSGLIKTQCNFIEVCLTAYQMLCTQGGVLEQELGSISLLFVFFNLWAFLIRAMYSAALASSLAIELYYPPFSSLAELLENGQYEFGVHRYSSAFDIYYKTDNLFIKKLNKAVMEQNISNLPTTYLQGLQRVCDKKNYVFMAGRMTVLKLKSRIPCKIYYLPNEAIGGSIAYAVSKRNDYLPFINRWLYVLNQVGLMAKLKDDIMGSKMPSLDDQQSLKSVGWEDIILLQSLLIAGVILSLLILGAEILLSRMSKNKTANNR